MLLLDITKVFVFAELFELPGLEDIVNCSHGQISFVMSWSQVARDKLVLGPQGLHCAEKSLLADARRVDSLAGQV